MKDEMNNLEQDLQRRFESLKDIPDRDENRASMGRAMFLTQAHQIRAENTKKQAVSGGFIFRLNNKLSRKLFDLEKLNFTRKERYKMLATVASLILTLTILFGGAGATVYAAQDSLPNEALYSLKVAAEDLRMELTRDPQAQFQLSLDLGVERVREMVMLNSEGKPIPEGTALRYENHLNYAFQLAAQFDDPAMVQAAQQIRAMLQEQERIMTQAMTNAPEFVDPQFNRIREMVQERVRLMDCDLDDPLALRQMLQQQFREQLGQPETPPAGDGGYGPGPVNGTPYQNNNEVGPGPNENPPGGWQEPGPNTTPGEGQGDQNGSNSDNNEQPSDGKDSAPGPDNGGNENGSDDGSGGTNAPTETPAKNGDESGSDDQQKNGKP